MLDWVFDFDHAWRFPAFLAGLVLVVALTIAPCVSWAAEQGDQRRAREEQEIRRCVYNGGTVITTGGSQGRTICVPKEK